MFWIGTFEQVVLHDNAAASISLEHAKELTTIAGDRLVLSCIERHLGFIDAMGRANDARGHLKESVNEN